MMLRCRTRPLLKKISRPEAPSFPTAGRLQSTLARIHQRSTIAYSQSHPYHQVSLLRSPPLVSPLRPRLGAGFHSTPRNQGLPLIPLLASIFKASAGLEIVRTASRIALTFIPFILFKKHRSKKIIKYAAIHGIPASEETRQKHLKKILISTKLLRLLLTVPFVLFWSTIIASLERTPLTGRWRMILLSPEEEDEIASQLAGPGWYKSVGEILADEGSPRIISASDWRYQWVQDTLRKLEASIPVLSREPELCPRWMENGLDAQPLPPPADFPLRPRPRGSEYLRWFCDSLTSKSCSKIPGGPIPGPPYSLLVVDKPDASNAFSYGFGPNGGSGIVVYTGFLDDIFSRLPLQWENPQPPQTSLWSRLFGGLFSNPVPLRPTPTPDQTSELAILIAHEMAHLILAHHLESLSSVNVIMPGTLSIVSDVIRVLIFPVTMLFGPFVNDAVAQLGKVGSGELAKISEYCTSAKQEIEADVVSARLLAHAGFDARDAVKFWENRSGAEGECARHGQHGQSEPSAGPMTVARKIMGSTHPINQIRVDNLRQELARWEKERQRALLAS